MSVTKVVQESIRLGKESVLCQNLGREKMGKNGERGCDDRWETRLEMIICDLVFLWNN